ncbi:unnamed protein product, partial [Rotaria sp. Silwood2]
MAHYSGSQTPAGTKRSSYTGAKTHPTFDDDSNSEVEGENDLDNDYPVIRDVPFYHSQQRPSHNSKSNRSRTSDEYYTPQLKKKRGSKASDRLSFDPWNLFGKQLEEIKMAVSDVGRKVDLMAQQETEVGKQLGNVDKRITGLARQIYKPSTRFEVPREVPKVMYGGQNLLAGAIEPTPGGLMKQLVNALFTKDEIILGHHDQIVLVLIGCNYFGVLEAVKKYFFSDDDENFKTFWDCDGKITRGNQKRGRAHREK